MKQSTEKRKMVAGEYYSPADELLTEERVRARRLCREYNGLEASEADRRRSILQDLLGSMGGVADVEPPFRCDYGYNIHVGKAFYANFDLIVLDVCPVRIGDHCLVGPRVCILTATHPLDLEERASGLEFGRPVTLGNHVWIGAGAVINPGVTLGDGVVVGSGAVVTKSFGSHVVLGGVPARVLRRLA